LHPTELREPCQFPPRRKLSQIIGHFSLGQRPQGSLMARSFTHALPAPFVPRLLTQADWKWR
jgi:hypothetical protein